MTVANLVTLLRVLLVPVIVYALIEGLYGWAFAMFVAAGLSDAVDGAIARLFDQQSELGVILDPIADKLLLVSVFVMLGFLEALPTWLVTAVVSRDLVIVSGVLITYLLGHPMTVRPALVSKFNTAAQIALAALVLLALALEARWPVAIGLLVWTTALLTAASLVLYTGQWLRHVGADANE